MKQESTAISHQRRYGWLAYLYSLPSPYGIGDLEAGALLLTLLYESGASLWQWLPIHPLGYGESPYAASSAFALEPLMISPSWLYEDGFLTQSDLKTPPAFPTNTIDYPAVRQWKKQLLYKSFIHWKSANGAADSNFLEFCHQQRYWLEEYALYAVLKMLYGHTPWYNWPAVAKNRDPDFCRTIRNRYHDQLLYIRFIQWIASTQLSKLVAMARKLGILLIGDLPLFVNYDSADVWAHPELFKLDKQKSPKVVSGVPPDYFSSTGQRWGNPQYNWKVHRQQHFQWWIERFRHLLHYFDLIRIDHFRGLAAVWEIPADAPDARQGRWVKTPGKQLLRTLQKTFGTLPLLVEDLGFITPDVLLLRDTFDLPGMRVLQFGLESENPAHPFLPHNFDTTQTVLYTGTHDNNTSKGWFLHLSSPQKTFIFELCGQELSANEVVDWMIDSCLFSTASYVIFPLHDILRLGEEARLNTPGKAAGNWTYRFSLLPSSERLASLRKRAYLSNRLPSTTTVESTDITSRST